MATHIQAIEAAHAEWSKRNFPNSLPHQPLLGIAEEVGELCHAHLKLEEGIRGTELEHTDAKEDAVGDIVMYLLHYCRLNNLSFALCIDKAWNEIKERDWIKNPQSGK